MIATLTSNPAKATPQILVPNRQNWHPDMFPKQMAFFNDTTRFRLASGPRYCGKSIAVYNTILKHAWSTKNARVAIISKSIRNAKVGVWGDITTHIIQPWLDARLTSPYAVFDWVKEPSQDGATRMGYFRVSNWYGGVSEIQLHSLDYDGDVAAKLMNSSFSCIYVSELQNFEDVAVFNISILQLRMMGIPHARQIFLSDSNPPETGPDHFAYKLWFTQRTQEEPPENCKTPEQVQEFRDYQKQFGLHEFDLNDNVYGDPGMISNLKMAYADDEQGYQRFILGKWTRALSSKEFHFRGIWRPELHVIGDVSSPNKSDRVIAYPTEECEELCFGWDLGDSVNNAFVIMEEIVMEGDVLGYVVLRELVWVGIQEPLSDFVEEALAMIDEIISHCKRPIRQRHWSDNSAFRFSSKSEETDALMLHKMSLGKVTLLSASSAKKHQGVRRRIKLVQDLLKQGRLLVSANCTNTVAMFENLKSGKLKLDGTGETIIRGSEFKHVWDGISYVLHCQLFAEYSEGPQKPNLNSGLISLPM